MGNRGNADNRRMEMNRRKGLMIKPASLSR